MQAVDRLAGTSSTLKRKGSTELHGKSSTKRAAAAGSYEPGPSAHHIGIASVTQPPVTILPRPANGFDPAPNPSPPVPAAAPAKKRGRPSRADKARRDLRPLLPQHLAPRPPDHPSALFDVRPILPAPQSAHQRRSHSPALGPRTPTAPMEAHRRTMPSVDNTRPVSTFTRAKPDGIF